MAGNEPRKNAPPISTLQDASKDLRAKWIVLGLVIAFTACAFFGTTQLGWTNWDDNFYVYENEMVKKADYGAIFTTPVIGNYNPLPIAMYAWEWKQVKDAAWFYHFNNLWMHLACVALVFWLMLLLGLKPIWAGIAALMFGIHPMRVESVAWVTERKDVMYGMFYLGSLVAFLRYRATKAAGLYAFACLLFVLALFSKIQAVTLPLVLLAIDWYQGRKWEWKLILEKIPFFVGAAAVGGIGVYVLSDIHGLNAEGEFGFGGRLALGLSAYCVYVVKALVPYETCMVYPYPESVGALHFVGILGAVGLVVGAILLRKIVPAVTFGMAFFTVNVVFLLQIVSAGHAYQADRFTYIGYMGLFFGLAMLGQTAANKWKSGKPIALAVSGLLVVVFTVLSVRYIPKWTNSETIWSDVIAKYPKRFALAYVNRGEFRQTEKKGDLGLADFTTAIALEPRLHLGYLHRGDIYFETGEDAKAMADYTKVLELLGSYGPDELKNDAITQAIGNRGSLYAKNGRLVEALADLNVALEGHPDDLNLLNSRALTYFDLGRFKDAIVDFGEILRQDPDALDALVNRGVCYMNIGSLAAAVADFDQVLLRDPQNAAALENRGIALGGGDSR